MYSSSAFERPMKSISADKPDMHCVVVFYNITWDNGRFKSNARHHEKTLSDDIRIALEEYCADVVLLSECGYIGEGLKAKLWLPMIRRICGPGFSVTFQSHYTSIVKLDQRWDECAPHCMLPKS